MTLAYSYIRFSSLDQIKGDSLRRQFEATRRYCDQHRLLLDDSLTMRDLGVSAFRSRNATHGALARFFDAIEAGRVKPGSVLIVESLDRLSRAEVLTALELFIRIINAEIMIVTVLDGKEYTKQSVNANPFDLMYSVMVMSRANEESTTKSKRLASSWEQKRMRAAERPVTSRCPGWLQLSETGKFVFLQNESAIVRRIVNLALSGRGAPAITALLNRERVPPISKRKKKRPTHWNVATIRHITRSRTLIGEYQPHRYVNGKPVPEGESIKGYYPGLISENEFYRLQAGISARSKVRGRGARNVVNLFGKVLVSGQDDGTIVLMHRRKGSLDMVSANFLRGLSTYRSFNYHEFEHHFLQWVKELTLEEEPLRFDTDALTGRLAEVRERIIKTQKAIDESGNFDAMLSLLKRLSGQEASLTVELEEARSKRNAPVGGEVVAEVSDLTAKLEKLDGEELRSARERLRSRITLLCRRIRVWIGGKRNEKVCIADVEFMDNKHRVFAVRTERGKPTAAAGTPQPVNPTRLNIERLMRYYPKLLKAVAHGKVKRISTGIVFYGNAPPIPSRDEKHPKRFQSRL